MDDKQTTFTLDLTEDDLHALTFAIGVAAGVFSQAGKISPSWLRLVNKVNRDNPHFMPYGVDS